MIPQTYPSVIDGGVTKMVVYQLSSITGLQPWVDFIPVKSLTTGKSNHYDGYIEMSPLVSTTGKQAWLDYIPVYVSDSYTVPFSTNVGGYIPGKGVSIFQGLLDLYPGAASAYSTRKLRGAYSGPCVRVRRSSDNAEQDFGFSTSPVSGEYWLDTTALLAFCGAGSGFLTTLYDQSPGSAVNATQASAGSQPMVVSSGVLYTTATGKPSLFYQGTGWFRQATGHGVFNNKSYAGIFTIYERLSGSVSSHILSCYSTGTSTTANRVSLESSDIVNANTFARRLDADSIISDANTQVAGLQSIVGEVRYSTGMLELFINGATNGGASLPSGSGSTSATDSLADPRIGIALTGSNPVFGHIPELIEYNTDQSTNRSAIITNQRTAFGI